MPHTVDYEAFANLVVGAGLLWALIMVVVTTIAWWQRRKPMEATE